MTCEKHTVIRRYMDWNLSTSYDLCRPSNKSLLRELGDMNSNPWLQHRISRLMYFMDDLPKLLPYY